MTVRPRDHRRRRHARAGGVVTAMAALTMAMPAPQAATAGSVLARPVQLLSSPLQGEIDQLLQAEQQVIDINSQYSFTTPYDLTRLPAYVQNLALTVFAIALGDQARSGTADLTVRYAPYAWNAPAADPHPYITLANPDNLYSPLPVDPTQTYAVTVHPGPGTGDMTFVANAGNGVTSDYTSLTSAIDLANATPNPDGTYTVMLSSSRPPDTPAGNWVDTTGADRVVVRDSLSDWGLIHDDLTMQQVGVPATTNALPHLSDDQIATLLNTVAANLVGLNAAGTYFNTQRVFAELPANTFTPIKETVSNVPNLGELGSLLPGQISTGGHFVLEPDQALIVKVPDIQASYTGFQLADAWAQTLPFATVQGSLNNTQAFHDPDGFTYYVISSKDPGVANWVDNSGVADGEVYLRFINVTGALPTTEIASRVVDVADVRQFLPADTPLVTAAERIAELPQRLFEYDYAINQSHNLSWVGANLQMDQVMAAIGTDQFNVLFGAQQDVPSVLDRLTPALTPDLFSVAGHLLAHPGAGLTAIGNNVPLAIKDIELPTVLAVLRMVDALGSGGQGLAAVVNQTLTDPATSITAGLLNARDDLAVAILNANSSTVPSDTLWNSLSELNHALGQAVSHMVGSSAAVAADIDALGADLAPAG